MLLHIRSSQFDIVTATLLKLLIVHLLSHCFTGTYTCDTEADNPGYLPMPQCIECILHGGVLHPIFVFVLEHDELHRLFNLCPVFAQKGLISTHQMFPINAQNSSRLTIDRRAGFLAPDADHAGFLIKAYPQINPFASIAL